MKIPLLIILTGLVIGFALPTVAQDQKAVDPEVRQQIESVGMRLGEAMNNHDATAGADVYTLDAIRVLDWTGGGTFVGREAIEKDFANHFASFPPDVTGKLIQVYAIGDQIAEISEWSSGAYMGYSSKIYARDADTWKIRLEYNIMALVPR
jgi:ketosteroid isomerase-like protein